MALKETKSLCSVRNSPKTAVSTEPASVTSAPPAHERRARRAAAHSSPGNGGGLPPCSQQRARDRLYRSWCENGCGTGATHGGGIQRGKESSTAPQNTLPGSCCKVSPFPLQRDHSHPVCWLSHRPCSQSTCWASTPARHISPPQPQASPRQRDRGQACVQGITGFLWDAPRSRPRIGALGPFLQEQRFPVPGVAKSAGAEPCLQHSDFSDPCQSGESLLLITTEQA